MVTECDSKPNGIGPTETGIAQTVEDCLEREGCVCEACGTSWTTEAIERGLTWISDPISRPFFKGQPKLVEYLINLVRNHGKSPHHDDIVVKDMSQQVVISNASGHSAQLDIVARDENDKIYNIEFQSRRETALAQRSFFYAALLFFRSVQVGCRLQKLSKSMRHLFSRKRRRMQWQARRMRDASRYVGQSNRLAYRSVFGQWCVERRI